MNVIIGSFVQPPVTYTVKKYSKAAKGGCKEAEIEARGNLADLRELMRLLGSSIKVDHKGRSVWWGYISEVQVHVKKTDWIATTQYMANRVAVAYEAIAAGQQSGTRATTDYTEDRASIALYGIKELLDSSTGTTAAHAIIDRDAKLAQRKLPHYYPQPGGTDGEPFATIYCKGWYSTLEWRYANIPVEFAMGYQTIGTKVQDFGFASPGTTPYGVQQVAQAFDVGATAINCAAVEIYIKKIGTGHTDNVTVAICANPNDDEPGSQIASGTILAADITTSYGWHRATFGAEELAANTSYFLVVKRSGDANGTNYYSLLVDEKMGYPAGPCKRYADGNWIRLLADMPWRLYADVIVPTAQQIKTLLVNYGQFLTVVRQGVESGVSTESYQNGDKTALDVLDHLCEMGTSNNRRILIDIDEHRQAYIYEEPAATQIDLFVDDDQNFYSSGGGPVEKYMCPCAVWAKPIDSSIQFEGLLQNPFIEEMEYSVSDDTLTPTARSIEDIWLAMTGGLKRG